MFALEFLEGLFGQQSGNRGNHHPNTTKYTIRFTLVVTQIRLQCSVTQKYTHPNIFADTQIKQNTIHKYKLYKRNQHEKLKEEHKVLFVTDVPNDTILGKTLMEEISMSKTRFQHNLVL